MIEWILSILDRIDSVRLGGGIVARVDDLGVNALTMMGNR